MAPIMVSPLMNRASPQNVNVAVATTGHPANNGVSRLMYVMSAFFVYSAVGRNGHRKSWRLVAK